MSLYVSLSRRFVQAAPRAGAALSRFHAWAYRRSGGRIGGRYIGRRVLVLGTVGRRTGRRRETPMWFIRDGDAYVVGASNAGAPTAPAWFHNLMAAGRGDVTEAGKSTPVSPRIAEGEERQRLWVELNRLYAGYDEYQAWTEREIPVVVLEPAG
jgi:deazaflavin-dependent oxidoreductase (nitroreductase family)